VLGLEGGNVRNSGEDVASVGSSSFNAVSVVNSSLSSLGIDIEPLKVVVEVH
jgi:hypothetical protein